VGFDETGQVGIVLDELGVARQREQAEDHPAGVPGRPGDAASVARVSVPRRPHPSDEPLGRRCGGASAIATRAGRAPGRPARSIAWANSLPTGGPGGRSGRALPISSRTLRKARASLTPPGTKDQDVVGGVEACELRLQIRGPKARRGGPASRSSATEAGTLNRGRA